MKKFFSIYQLPLFAIAFWLVVATIKFGKLYWQGLIEKLTTLNWWVESTLSFLIFTILVTWILTLTQKSREKHDKEPHQGWRVLLKGLKTGSPQQDIFWMDAQKNKESPFEKWKFVKTAVSSTCWIKTPNLETAEKRWLSYSKKGIIVDFSKMTEKDIDRWLTEDLPDGWEWQDIPKPPEKDTIRTAVCVKCD